MWQLIAERSRKLLGGRLNKTSHIFPSYHVGDSYWPPCHSRVLDINKRLHRHPGINIRMASVPNIICLGPRFFDQTKY